MARIRDFALTENLGSTSASVACNMPIHEAGDVLVYWASKDGTTAITASAGWTNIQDGASAGAAYRVMFKVAASDGETLVVVTSSADNMAVIVASIEGADGSSLANFIANSGAATAESASDDATSPYTGPSTSTNADTNCLIFHSWHSDANPTPIAKEPLTNMDACGGITTSNALGVAYTFQKAAGSVSAAEWYGAANDDGRGVVFAVKDASSGTKIQPYSDSAITSGTMLTLLSGAAVNSETYSGTIYSKVGDFVATAYSYAGGSYTDVTTNINSDATGDVTLGIAQNDALYLGFPTKFTCANVLIGTAPIAWTGVAEISNGGGWSSFSSNPGFGVTGWKELQTTSAFYNTWDEATVNGTTLYWMRIRTTSSNASGSLIASQAIIGKYVNGVNTATTANSGYNLFVPAANQTGSNKIQGFKWTPGEAIDMNPGILYGTVKGVSPLDMGSKGFNGMNDSLFGSKYITISDGSDNLAAYMVHCYGGDMDLYRRNPWAIDINGSPNIATSRGSVDKNAISYVQFCDEATTGNAGQSSWSMLLLASKFGIAGGTSANPIDLDTLQLVVNNSIGVYPFIITQGAAADIMMPMQFGGNDPIYLSVDSKVFQFPGVHNGSTNTKWNAAVNVAGINFYPKSGDTIKMTNCTFASPSAYRWEFDASMASSGFTLDFSGSKVSNATVTLQSAADLVGVKFDSCPSFTQNGASLSGCEFNNTKVTSGAPANAALITNSSFASSGTGHAVEISGTAADITLTNVDFTGYASNDGSTGNEAIYVNIASGTMTINVSGGTTPSIRTAGATVIVQNAVTITINNLVANSQVYIYNSTGSVEIDNILETTTTYEKTLNFTVQSTLIVKVRKAGYKTWETIGVLTSSGLSLNAAQEVDLAYNASYNEAMATDWTVNTSTKKLTRNTTNWNTVRDFHSYWNDLFSGENYMEYDVPTEALTKYDILLDNGYTFTAADSFQKLKTGSIADPVADDLWGSIITLGNASTETMYLIQNDTKISSYWSAGNIDILLKVKSGGVLIDSGVVHVYCRDFNRIFDHSILTITEGGKNYTSISTGSDSNNQTAAVTVAGYNDIIIDEAGTVIDITQVMIDGEDTPADYEIGIDAAGRSVQEVYEYLKYVTRGASTYSLQSDNGEEYYSENPGSYAESKNGPFGTLIGGVLYGARGVWITNLDTGDILNYVLTDSSGTVHQAAIPSIQISVTNIVDGSRIYVYNESDATVLANEIVSGTTWQLEYSGQFNKTILVKLRKMGYDAFETFGVTNAGGLALTAAQTTDPVVVAYPNGIGTDFSVNTTTSEISHATGSTVYTLRQFHSWLVDLFAGETYMSYDVPTIAYTNYEFEVINGWMIANDADHQYLKTGSIICDNGATLWGNLYTVGTLSSSESVYIIQNDAKLTAWWSTGHIDILVKVKTGGSLIDSGKLEVFTRNFNRIFDHTTVTIIEGGKNPASLTSGEDSNNQTASGTVAGYNDIALDETGAVVDIAQVAIDADDTPADYTLGVDCAGRNVAEVYEYLKYVTRATSTFTINGDNGEEHYKYSSFQEIKNGPIGQLIGGVFYGAQGVWLTNVDSTDALNYVLTDNAGVTHQAATPPVYISVTNIVDGSRLQIFDITNDTELYNDVVSGTEYNLEKTWVEDLDIRIRLSYVNGTTAYMWFETQGTFTSSGMNIRVSQVLNSVYSTNNIDGSTVTECSISGTTVRIYVDDPDNTTTAQRIYNWFQYYLFTESGIRDQDGTYISATDSTHYVLDNSMKIVNQDIVNPLNLTGANIIPASGASTNIFDLSNGASIALNFNRVEGFAYSSGSGLSPEEHNALLAIPLAAENAEAVWDMDISGSTQNGSSGKMLKDNLTLSELLKKVTTNKTVDNGTSVDVYDDNGIDILGTFTWDEVSGTRGKLT